MEMDRKWMYLADRSCKEYKDGVKSFFEKADHSYRIKDLLRCPCRGCNNLCLYHEGVVEKHLHQHGFTADYKRWIYHGEEFVAFEGESVPSLVGARGKVSPESAVESLFIGDGKPRSPLFPGREEMRGLDLFTRLMNLKVLNGWSDGSLHTTLRFLKSAFSTDCENVPDSLDDGLKLLREVGLGYELIHACKYDCVLFWKEHSSCDECPICLEPRFKYEDENTGERVPQKVMYYFPLKPRLQRLFMSEKTASDMRWHKDKRVDVDGLLSHPADSSEWKLVDEEYPWFAKDSRNVRLGLATKELNIGGSYSMWPVTLVPYNLPPSKCMNGEFFMMTLLIPGPNSPGIDIDVYLRPLIDELKDLWNIGVETHDAMTGETFRLHASLLWTISDFPMYESLTGWCLGGVFSCLTCNCQLRATLLKSGEKFGLETRKCYFGHRRFLPPTDRTWRGQENRDPPVLQSGEDVLRQVDALRSSYKPGKNPTEKRSQNSEDNWMKKSVFFELEYWPKLKIRHNLDLMYVEKSLCDNIIGTLLKIKGMTKDTKIDRLDLACFKTNKELHFENLGNSIVKRPACYTLPNLYPNGNIFRNFLKDTKLPEAYTEIISKKVSMSWGRVWELKAHECHLVIQRLLPLGVHSENLYEDFTTTLTELATFFQLMCAKTLRFHDLNKLEERVGFVYSKLERIYPPAFFDIMTHSALHLPLQAKMAGPVEFRSMYPFEKDMEKLGKYVQNKTRPEEAIAEAYSTNEAVRFCSMYLRGCDTEKKANQEDEEKKPTLSVFSQRAECFGEQEFANLSKSELGAIRSYVLRNCQELEPYIQEYEEELMKKSCDTFVFGDEDEEDEFPFWFEMRINELYTKEPEKVTQELQSLAVGPSFEINIYPGCVVDGIKFLTVDEDKNRTTQNCGVFCVKEHEGENVDFYGLLSSVYEVRFKFGYRVIMFKCKWFDTNPENNADMNDCNIPKLPHNKSGEKWWYENRPYLLATQATPAFYPKSFRDVIYLQKFEPRLFWDVAETINRDDERVEAAKPEHCNFKWTKKVGVLGESFLCDVDFPQRINTKIIPISKDDVDVIDKSKMFEALFEDSDTSYTSSDTQSDFYYSD